MIARTTTAPTAGKVMVVTLIGRAVVGDPGSAGNAVARRSVLAEGSTLRLEESVRVGLDWKGRGLVEVGGPACLSIGRAGVVLERGDVFCSVEPGREGFRVRTPIVDVSVVGTRFNVASLPGGPTRVDVFEGRVMVQELASGGRYVLKAGQNRAWTADAVPDVPVPTSEAGESSATSTASSCRVRGAESTCIPAASEAGSVEGARTLEEGF